MTHLSDQNAGNSQEVDSFHHDLRTQLSAIVSLTNLIKTCPGQDKCGAFLDALEMAANNAIAMVEDGSKMHQAPPIQTAQLVDLLQDFERLAKGWAEARGASFTLEMSTSMRQTRCPSPDPVYFHRLFTLLLDNALKYAPGADITLKASLDSDCALAIDFSDNGPGFGMADPSLLFEPYHRGNDADKVSGTGLGLWSVRNIVMMMNGKIWAASNTPTGAVFYIRLPLECPKATKASANSSAQENAPALSLANSVIHQDAIFATTGLIVDDNETNQLILGEILKAMEYNTRFASSGEDALATIRAAQPDFVLMDIRMSGMDGWELARQIRAKDEYSGLPLVAVSSDPVPADLGPFDGWLQRPIDPEALQEILTRSMAD